jgi:dCMP deaminase
MVYGRPNWDEYFLKLAFVAAERSTCLHHHVGAVAVRNKNVLSTGYNGSAPGHLHCTTDLGYCNKERAAAEKGETVISGKGFDDCPAIHAEENLIIQSAKNGARLEGATVYSTHQPCFHCSNKILSSGIIAVKFCFPYQDTRGIEFLRKSGIECEKIYLPGISESLREQSLDISILK